MPRRYLIGGGEQLALDVDRPGRMLSGKAHPYTFEEARERLSGQWEDVSERLRGLPSLGRPKGRAVVAMTLHPSYLAKTYYPAGLLKELGLRHVGSRAVHIEPDHVMGRAATKDQKQTAPLLYLAGDVDAITSFADVVGRWRPADESIRDEFRQIETIDLPGDDRLKALAGHDKRFKAEIPLEVVLHDDEEVDIVEAFEEYLAAEDMRDLANVRRQIGGLHFLALRGTQQEAKKLLSFSFLRAIRRMPRIKPLDPMIRTRKRSFPVNLPEEDATAPDISAAILDGGLPPKHGLSQWVTLRDADGVGAPLPEGQQHGLAVTSAFLFGPLVQGLDPEPPFSKVDHWRVYGDDTTDDDWELLTVLDRIETIVGSRRYDFVNLSLGPDMALEDDDVSRWTSTLDALLQDGETVLTVACGNNGEDFDDPLLCRVQCPADGVNVLSIGAADRDGRKWQRAPYSAKGPGRSPGYVKPDVVAYGGSHAEPFLLLTQTNPPMASGDMGTSMASPLGMRMGVGVRSQFSEPLWAPTVKALLAHRADSSGHDKSEVGWGRISSDLDDLILCQDGEAHIVYQRTLPTSQAVRLPIPIPQAIEGNVEIKATFCFYTDVDPEDALNYTRAGLDIQFRPNMNVFGTYEKDGRTVRSKTPKSDEFFKSNDFYATEVAQRGDAQKWETILSRTRRKRASSLYLPAFDVAHLARSHGHDGPRRGNVKFALILSLRNRHMRDLYEQVLAQHPTQLYPLTLRARIRGRT